MVAAWVYPLLAPSVFLWLSWSGHQVIQAGAIDGAPALLAIPAGMAAFFTIILSPLWLLFILPRWAMPRGEMAFAMFTLCNVALPAIPALSDVMLWSY